jgi:hypothetical protein
MATVQLSDIIDTIVFQDIAPENDPILTRLFDSGMVIRNPFFDTLASAAGDSAELPYWKDLSTSSEPNYSSDQASDAAPDKIVQAKQITRKAHVNNGWSAMDLARELAMGEDALRHIRNRVDAYWTKQWQQRIVSATLGVFNENVANDGGDMVYDISSESIAGQGAGTRFSRAAFVNAAFTLGDHYENIAAIMTHSVVFKDMVDQDDIDFVRDADGRLGMPTYLGKPVIVDDGSPKVAGTTDGFRYLTTLYGQEVFAYGEGTPPVPVEVWRNPQTGDGGGEEQLWSRKTWLLHPIGHSNSNTAATGSGGNQNQADLANAANWSRVVQRKNVPVAFLVTN